MKIAICDDEESELLCLSALMTEYQLSRKAELHCRTFQNGTDLLCGMKGGEYDLIFLDVIMPSFSGIGVARELRELDKSVKLVFLTVSPDFAMESYSVGAYHYSLKPASKEELFPLLDKMRSELEAQEEQGLLLKDRGGVIRVPFARLEYVEVMNKTVSFHLTDGVVREVTASLSDFEGDLLSRPEFLKMHRSYLANLSHIQAINAKGAVTRAGHTIPVSRLQYNQIKDSYLRFQFESETKPSVPEPPAESKPKPQCRPWQILVVDDDPADLSLWAGVLRTHGCVTQTADSGATALRMAAEHEWDLVLLDVMMPGEDGFALCKRLGELICAPVIFLSCLTDTDKQMQGFYAGGVDYITKDTPAELFWTKVETRIKLAGSDRVQFCFGPLLLDLTVRKVFWEGKELVLTSIEFDLIWRLSKDTAHVFTPEEIFGAVWGSQPWDGGHTVQVHMSRLRRKLEKACDAHYFIETVWGQGYRFVPWNDD